MKDLSPQKQARCFLHQQSLFILFQQNICGACHKLDQIKRRY